MPYYLHHKDHTPSVGTPFTTRQGAYSAKDVRPSDYRVTFEITEEERYEWYYREENRFYNVNEKGEPRYIPLPKWYMWEPRGGSIGPYDDIDSPARIEYETARRHYVHLSLDTPGMVAYTPSDEHGYQNRHVKVRIGRYLEQHLSHYYTPEQREVLIKRVQAYGTGLQLATSTEDIITAYTGEPHGSCMGHPVSEYSTMGVHPVCVYGESDLAVAYLGDLADVDARCLVWPAEKRYCRIYGDQRLREVLHNAGYTRVASSCTDHGSLAGAMVRAITVTRYGRERYILPYLDCAGSADLTTRNGVKMLQLRNDEDGDYKVWETHGLAEPTETHHCERCEGTCEEDESYCRHCEEHRSGCHHCGETIWTDGNDYTTVGDENYCDYCARHHTNTCAVCDGEWFEPSPRSPLCHDCRDTHIRCGECETFYSTDEYEHCPDCEEEDKDTYVPLPAVIPFINLVLSGGSRMAVRVETTVGPFTIHHALHDPSQYTITHTVSTMIVTHATTLNDAIRRARVYARITRWDTLSAHHPGESYFAWRERHTTARRVLLAQVETLTDELEGVACV